YYATLYYVTSLRLLDRPGLLIRSSTLYTYIIFSCTIRLLFNHACNGLRTLLYSWLGLVWSRRALHIIGPTWLACLLIIDVLDGNEEAGFASLALQYTVSYPYTETFLPDRLKVPVHVWYEKLSTGDRVRLRVDVYGGKISFVQDYKQGIAWTVHPRINAPACDVSKPVQFQDTLDIDTLPNITTWRFAGTNQVGKVVATLWQGSSINGETTSRYTFSVDPNGRPLHLAGVSLDQAIFDFTSFKPGNINKKVWQVPAVCATVINSMLKTRNGISNNTSSSVGLKMMSLLPTAVVEGDTGLQAHVSAAWKDNANFVETHNARVAALSSAGTSTGCQSTRRSRSLLQALPQATTLTYLLNLNRFASMHSGELSWGLDTTTPKYELVENLPIVPRMGDGSSGGSGGSNQTNASLPAALDYRATGADGPGVKDQLYCASCWAFSTAGAMTGAWFKATGQSLSFSEQQLVDCAWNFGLDGCSGGDVPSAVKYVMAAGGIAQEGDYQFTGQEGTCRGAVVSPNNTRTGPAPPGSPSLLNAFSGIKRVTPNDTQAIMEALYLYGPLPVYMYASMPDFQFYSSGIYSNPDCPSRPREADHAVLLMGYGTDNVTNIDYWIVKNSWSRTWGMDGYFKISRQYDCGIRHHVMVVEVNSAAAAAVRGQSQ
ncbi:hypothetical protein Vafri_13985, partial [Volvox africanus]